MGKVACAYDKSLAESFFGSMQIELLERRRRPTRAKLANAMFERIDGWHKPSLPYSVLNCLSPIEFEKLHTAVIEAA